MARQILSDDHGYQQLTDMVLGVHTNCNDLTSCQWVSAVLPCHQCPIREGNTDRDTRLSLERVASRCLGWSSQEYAERKLIQLLE